MLSEKENLRISELKKEIKHDLACVEFIVFAMDLDHDNLGYRNYCDERDEDYQRFTHYQLEDFLSSQLEFVKYVNIFLKEFRPNQYRIIMEDDCVKVERK